MRTGNKSTSKTKNTCVFGYKRTNQSINNFAVYCSPGNIETSFGLHTSELCVWNFQEDNNKMYQYKLWVLDNGVEIYLITTYLECFLFLRMTVILVMLRDILRMVYLKTTAPPLKSTGLFLSFLHVDKHVCGGPVYSVRWNFSWLIHTLERLLKYYQVMTSH